MRLRTLRIAHAVLALALALVWSGALAWQHLAGHGSFLDRIEAPLLDLRFTLAGPRQPPPDIVLIAIDDETVRDSGGYPLPRSRIAAIIAGTHALGAAAIAVDILFLETGSESEDAALARAFGGSGAVLAAAGIFAPGEGGASLPVARRILWPADRFRSLAPVGIVNVAVDQGGTARHAPLVLTGPEGIVPSQALRLASKAAGSDPVLGPDTVRLGSRVVSTDLGWNLPLRFYGPTGTFRTVSAARVLAGEVPRGEIEGRIVLVGVTAVATADSFSTPYDPALPGMEVLATAVAHLRNADGLVRDRAVRKADAAATIALACGTALGLALLPPGAGLLLATGAGLSWLAVAAVAFTSGLWLSAILPIAGMAPGLVFGLLGRQALDRIRTGRLLRSEEALRRLQAPALAARVAVDPAYLAEPVAQEAAVVFLDLTGFTGVSERLGPERTRDMLKAFHGVLSEAAEGRGGVVMNFMGDGAMVLFGVPDPAPDDAERALSGASEIVDAVAAWLATGESGLRVRVGAHHGTVVLSRLGSSAHEQITVTGDSVNVASRLLEVAKGIGASLVVSEDLLRAAGEPPAFVQTIEGRRRVAIRGRSQALAIAYRGTSSTTPLGHASLT